MTTCKANTKSRISHTVLITLAMLTLTFLTTAANASCFHSGRGGSPTMPKTLLAQLTGSASGDHSTIVGLWHTTYTTSDGQVFQEAIDMWHVDGTELESANIDPIEGNVCMGVWKQSGSQVYLHHFGWGFDNLGNLIGAFTVNDILVLGNQGNSYSGSFDFKQYDNNGNLLLEVTGTIAATRIG